MRRRDLFKATAGLAALGVAGCGSSNNSPGASSSGGGASPGSVTAGTIKVAYQKFGNFTQMDTMFTNVKTDFEAKFAGSTLELIPIQAAENDYYTKLALMNRSASTAPDLMYEDTFMVRSDVAAGYLAPLDSYLNGWSDWSQFVPAAKDAGKADDGKIYGVSLGTDTRGLWYNKDLLANVGITGDWQPKDWNELLSVAKDVKAKLPGVIPLNIYSGKPNGEASVMQGFEMLLYGCPNGTLYNTDQAKWVVGSQHFKDSLDFIRTVYTQGLGPTPQQALDSNWGNVLASQYWPKNKIAMAIDGSWMPGNWLPKGTTPWAEWDKVMGWTGMPTQQGQAPGRNAMSGGWTLATGANCKNPDLAFQVMSIALSKKYALWNYINNSQIAVRTDCESDPSYLQSNASVKFFTDLVADTHFRPATADYPNISNAIQVAMEAVMTGQQNVDTAAAAYDKAVVQQVGQQKTMQG